MFFFLEKRGLRSVLGKYLGKKEDFWSFLGKVGMSAAGFL